jgi:hypothetical protein
MLNPSSDQTSGSDFKFLFSPFFSVFLSLSSAVCVFVVGVVGRSPFIQ